MDQLAARQGAGSDASLETLLASALDPLFARPSLIGVESAWYGHVPFARWIVRAARPSVLVELGAHAGVSYAAFCDAVLAEGLNTRCYAVDTWQGDEHAGFYDESVFEALRAFHDARYGGFSRLLRCTFDAALPYIPDGSVDLLHIDGRHRYEDVAYDFASWRPKLSPRAVVLFHDTNVRERDFGVWRFWAEQTASHPSFEFLHAHGLGVLAVGEDPPALVRALCRLDAPHDIGLLRDRFALLGERWALAYELANERRLRTRVETARAQVEAARVQAETRLRKLEAAAAARASLVPALAAARNQAAILEQSVAAMQSRLQAEQAARAAVQLQADGEAAQHAAWRTRAEAAETAAGELRGALHAVEAQRGEAGQALSSALGELHVARATTAALSEARAEMEASLSWRLTRPLRRATGVTRQPAEETAIPSPEPDRSPASPAAALPTAVLEPDLPEATAAPAPPPIASPEPADPRPRILFISGEPSTPGHHYRVLHAMRLAEAVGWRADWSEVAPVGPHTLARARVVVLWRVAWSPHVQGIISASGDFGARVLFDVDDLVFKPELARIEVIDGIRTTETTESAISSFFAMVNRAIDKCDLTLCTTEELAQHVRSIGRPAVVLPNGFDAATHARARLAARAWRAEPGDLVRIGYASGSRTHQRDFGVMAAPLAAVLRARPDARLVVFRDPQGGEGVVLLHEFPELADLAAQIEYRDMVPLPDLSGEVARFSINLAPLESGNVFCEAKSELKYFEAALVNVPTVASPSGPLARAIRHGHTGFLVATEQEWHDTLLQLVDDPALRHRIARNAYHDVLWRFGPRRREEMLAALLREIEGGAEGARAFELKLRRGDYLGPGLPRVPDAETLFEVDGLGEAEVTVTVPVYNYAGYVLEALESVRTQTLDPIDLVVVDDASTDESTALVLGWARHHANRFNRVVVRRHVVNAGLGLTRNSGFAAAETPFVLSLDADNRLHADCCAVLAEHLRASRAAFVYPSLRQFGDKDAVFGDAPYTPSRLVNGNYIDAMALVTKWAWAAAGGYDHVRFGWEDYDFWCRLAEIGLGGEHVRAVLADYRVHKASMLARSTDLQDNKLALIADMHRRHPWLRIAKPS